MCSFAQKVGLCGRLDPLGLIGHLSASVWREFRAAWEVVARRLLCRRLSERFGNSLWLQWGSRIGSAPPGPRQGKGCAAVCSVPSSLQLRSVLAWGTVQPWRREVVLSGSRCQFGSVPVCRKCVWCGAGAYSQCRWALASSLISLSAGGPGHSCLQN